MKEILLFIVGVPLGLWWSTVTILPLLYSVPKAAYCAWQGRLRSAAVFFYFRVFLFWFFFVGVLSFLLIEYVPALAVTVRESVGLNSGQLLGFIIGVGGVFTASGRKDLDADFWALMQAKNFTVTVGQKVALGKEPSSVEALKNRALQGDVNAQYNWGLMYAQGQGEPQNYTEAMKWWRIAAARGHAEAQYNLGLIYWNGEGVQQDYAEALKWFRLVAVQGYTAAQYNLGVMYRNGQGVPQDYVQAHKWFNLAAGTLTDVNRDNAVKARDLIAAKMTPAQIAEAQRLAREWRPATQEK